LYFHEDYDEYGFCSNFFKSPILIDGKLWPTTEHYFQAMKFPTRPEHQEKIRTNNSPELAKKLGYESEGFRPDWNDVKDEMMYRALLAKFTQHSDIR
jgi:N-glycosidase YbiA